MIKINDIGLNLGVKFLLYLEDLKTHVIINKLSVCLALESVLMNNQKWHIEENLFMDVPKCSMICISLKTYENIIIKLKKAFLTQHAKKH